MNIFGIHIGYRNQSRFLLTICLLLTLFLIYVTFIRKRPRRTEGFTQDMPFLVKRDQEMFDDFLAEIYDRIYQPRGPNHYISTTKNIQYIIYRI